MGINRTCTRRSAKTPPDICAIAELIPLTSWRGSDRMLRWPKRRRSWHPSDIIWRNSMRIQMRDAALWRSRSRLVRQCLTESAVLGLSGGALGILLADLGIRPFVALWPGTLPRAEEVQLDWHVLLFAVAASLVSGLLFGLAPALRAPARELEQTL